VAYSATKGAVIAFTKALAKELGPSHIRVNSVAPGAIDTEMNRHLSAEELAALAEETPLERLGQPEEVAQTIAFLASDEASFLTGQVLSPNGGLVIS
jgi:3-oxoacyl-[acyl-carrier protein] reductase